MTIETQAIVIGAGPSGLAAAACLKHAGIRFEILEKEGNIASSWRQHYERLHLHTTKYHSALPYQEFPSEYPMFVPRNLFIQYLELYAKKFEISPRFHQAVLRVSRLPEQGWSVETKTGTYRAPHLIVASGFNSRPVIPEFHGMSRFQGGLIHSSKYLNAKSYKGLKVLIVGMGNSGAEIALDLLENGATPTISLRGPVHITPRDLFGVPIQNIAIISTRVLPERAVDLIFQNVLRVLIGDLSRYGIRTPKEGIVRRCRENSRIPVIDIGTLAKVRSGQIQVRPGIAEFSGKEIIFQDGRHEEYDAVICATGYSTGFESLFDVNDWDSLKKKGPEGMSAQGLYFIGFDNVITGFLRQISIRAKEVASHIASVQAR